MFNEILKSVTTLINGGNAFDEKEDTVPIAKYLSLAYDIPADAIAKVARIKMDKIPDIILVSIDYKLDNRICDYIFYEGELVKVISFFPQLWNRSEANMVAMILAILGDINNTLIESYRLYIDQQMSSNSFVDILTYAPFIMAMGYIQTHVPFVTNQVISVTFRLMYPKVTEQSISSARKLLTQFTVSDLLDKCIWYGVSNNEYPDIRFFELPDPVVKSVMPGKGVWNLSDMKEDDSEEFTDGEPDNDNSDYQMSDEEMVHYLDAQNAYEEELEKEKDNFIVPSEDKDPMSKIVGYDTRKPISYTNYPGGKK